MANYQELIDRFTNYAVELVRNSTIDNEIEEFFTRKYAELIELEKTGQYIPHGKVIKKERITNVPSNQENTQENVKESEFIDKAPATRRTTRTTALKDAQNTLNIKGVIKKEKKSNVGFNSVEMPPPVKPIPKGRTKKGPKIKVERSSDVIIQLPHVSLISIDDSDEEEVEEEPVRSTRSKARVLKEKKIEEVCETIVEKSKNKKEELKNKKQEQKDGKEEEKDRKEEEKDGKDEEKDGKDEKEEQKNRKDEQKDGKDEKEEQKNRKEKQKDGKEENQKKKRGEKKEKEIEVEETEHKKGNRTDETFIKEQTGNLQSENQNNVNFNDGEDTTVVRTTRTKTRAMAAKTAKEESTKPTVNTEKEPSKRLRSPSFDKNEHKRKKSIENTNLSNETYIKTPPKPTFANETVVIPKEKRMVVKTPLNKEVNMSDLLTDDEDDRTYIKPNVPKTTVLTTKNPTTKKPIFSQYESSPVKKRVEAFEKLGAQTTPIETSKTLKKINNKYVDENQKLNVPKSKLQTFTPIKSAIPTFSAYKTSKSNTASKSALKDVLPPKSLSALKASQQDYMEREAKKREKEQEVLRKKEALLQAKKEETKRKLEEKHLKAQQIRLAQLKAKQEAEEFEKLEKIKLKQALAEKAAEKKYQEKKYQSKREEYQSPRVKKLNRPVFLDTTAPLLPVNDCYDSDDERRTKETFTRPPWTHSKHVHSFLLGAYYSGRAVTNTLFMRQPTTPDLEYIFGTINMKKLKRTSSAIWTKPPRFTLLPITQEEDESNASDESDSY